MTYILKSPAGNLALKRSYEHGGMGVSVMHKLYPGKIATFKQLNLLFTDEHISEKRMEILRKASPIASSTMHAYTKDETIRDFANEKGVVYIDGYYDGEYTRFGGFRLETLERIGINVDLPGAFLMANTGYSFTDVKYYNFSQSINFTVDFSDLDSTELEQVLHIVYGEFKNRELRYVDKDFHIPIGKLVDSTNPDAIFSNYLKPDSVTNPDSMFFSYLKPGPVILGGPDCLRYAFSHNDKRYIFNLDYEFGLNLTDDTLRFSPGMYGVIIFDK